VGEKNIALSSYTVKKVKKSAAKKRFKRARKGKRLKYRRV
jgi:hypothetical protein